MKKSVYLLLLAGFIALPFFASAQISLLKNINAAASVSGGNPSNLTALNGFVYFSATDGVTGTELWRTDGTSNGTTMVKDINPGDNSSNPSNFTVVGSYIYFMANDGDTGAELWRTDGTTVGTVLILDIYPGTASSTPQQFFVYNSTTLFFSAVDPTAGRELWKSDVTTKATSMVTDIYSGTSSSNPGFLTNVNGTIFFSAGTAASGTELWKTDGTAGNTVMVKDINPTGTSSSSPNWLTSFNNNLIFTANDGTNGIELWISNGTSLGTSLLKDINTTAGASSSPNSLTVFGSMILFAANDGVNGTELWRTDGTSGNTFMAWNINTVAGSGSMFSSNTFAILGTSAYFTASTGSAVTGTELYRYTSSASGTLMDINVGTGSSSPTNLVALNGAVFFTASTGTEGYELYRVTATTPIQYILLPGTTGSTPARFAALDATNVVFAANNGSGPELFKWNGTTNSQVIDLVSGSDGSSPSEFVYNSTLNLTFFGADDGTGRELWKTDGTTAGTVQVKSGGGINSSGAADITYLTSIAGFVYFQAFDGTDYEVWKSDGTSAGTVKIDVNPGSGSSYPYGFIQLNATEIVFQANTDATGTEICKLNINTNAFTVYDINPGTAESYADYFTVMGGVAYFVAENAASGREVFKFNGTTVSVAAELVAGTSGGDPWGLMSMGGNLYFTGYTAASGYELYKSNGTGFSLVKDIAPGASAHSYPDGMKAVGSVIYFAADDNTNGYELWKTDGLTANTVMVKDIMPGVDIGSNPYNFTEYNGKVYFLARDPSSGQEMFVTDGTSAGTMLFKDLNAGPSAGSFTSTVISGSNMYFSASESTGSRIYVTDGRTCATNPVTQFAGGTTASANALMTAPGNKMVFSMTLQGSGRELFLLDPSAVTLPTNTQITVQPQPVSVTMPAAASLSVTATGTALTYQWQKNSVNIPGATSATLNFASTSATDNGNYKVIVTGTCGQVTSNEVAVTINAVTPTAQPTGLLFSDQTPTSIKIKFTAASGSPTGYLVLRKKGSAPTEVPVDGTTYTAGTAFGTSFVVASGSAVEGTDSGLENMSAYYYAIFSYNGGGSLIKYLATGPLTGVGATLALEPTNPPTALVFSSVDGTTLSGSFTASASAGRYLVIRRPAEAPTATPLDAVSYEPGQVLGDATVVSLDNGTTFNDSGLTPQTLYFYQVFAANGPGPTVNYLTTPMLQGDVTTLAAQPEPPTLLKVTNVTAGSFTVSFTPPATAPEGYVVFRNAGATLTATPVDGTTYTLGQQVGDARVAYVGANTTFTENIPFVQFTYVVFPYNGTGSAINYRQATPLTALVAPDDTPPVITDETPQSVPSGGSVKIVAAVADGQSGIQGVTVKYRSVAAAESADKTVNMTLVANKYEFTVPATDIGDLGLQYVISATNTLQLVANKPGKTGLTFTDQTLAFSSFGEDQKNYRIVAVPLDLTSNSISQVFGDDLGTYDGKAWRMYHYSSGTTNELNANSKVEVGKGYWLIVRENKSIDTGPGTTTPVRSDAPFTIQLTQGWNQIGNPYNFNVLWSDVKTASNLNLDLRVFPGSGNFEPGSILGKYQGGFVLANTAATLVFPTEHKASAGRIQAGEETITNSIDQDAWEVVLNLKHGELKNPFGGFGMNKNADALYDEFDDFTLPRFLDYVELNHGKKLANISYAKDVIPTAANHTWEFTVEASGSGVTEITWDNSYFGTNDKQLVLWDEEESIPVDMRETSFYSFNQGAPHRFSVFYGDSKYISEKTSKDKVLIHNVSPNPSDSEVNFTFTIPGAGKAQVEVRILNTIGQPVTSVFNGILNGGYHEMSWSGKDAHGLRSSQGVYLLEVIANGQRLAKRVVLK